jgi:hypothetical protein
MYANGFSHLCDRYRSRRLEPGIPGEVKVGLKIETASASRFNRRVSGGVNEPAMNQSSFDVIVHYTRFPSALYALISITPT